MFDRFLNADAAQRFAIYLNDHLAGAAGGTALAERCADANADNDVGSYLRRTLIPQLADERQALEAVCERLDVDANPLKERGARAAVWLGKLKLNGKVASYSPSSRIVELESLIGAVNAKRQLWQTLIDLDIDAPEPETSFDRLQRQAEAQTTALQELHHQSLAPAFEAQ